MAPYSLHDPLSESGVTLNPCPAQFFSVPMGLAAAYFKDDSENDRLKKEIENLKKQLASANREIMSLRRQRR